MESRALEARAMWKHAHVSVPTAETERVYAALLPLERRPLARRRICSRVLT